MGPRDGLDKVVKRKILSPHRDSNRRSSSPQPSSVSIVTRLRCWTTGVQFPTGAMIGLFLFATAFGPAIGTKQAPIKFVSGAFTPGVKRPGHDTVHSYPSNAEFKNTWSYTVALPILLHGVVLS